MIPCLSLLCFMVFGPPGVALSAGPPAAPAPDAVSIQAYGRNGRCLAWTDGCVTCRAAEGKANCSTPGIACTPGTIACTQPTAD